MNKVIKSAHQYELEIMELNEEIEHLKESNKLLADFRDFITEDMMKTKDENNHLLSLIGDIRLYAKEKDYRSILDAIYQLEDEYVLEF